MFVLYKTVIARPVSMKIIYEENPASFLKDMKLIRGDTACYVTQVDNALIFRSSNVPLFADVSARYVPVIPSDNFVFSTGPDISDEGDAP